MGDYSCRKNVLKNVERKKKKRDMEGKLIVLNGTVTAETNSVIYDMISSHATKGPK